MNLCAFVNIDIDVFVGWFDQSSIPFVEFVTAQAICPVD